MRRALLAVAALACAWTACVAAEPPPSRSAPRAATTSPGDPGECDRKWREYFASERCFARFRTAHRSIKPEAFDVCGPPVPDPSRECTRRTP